MKQQTLEEAANKYRSENVPSLDKFPKAIKKAFIAGAAWQAKQMAWINVNNKMPEENQEYLVVLDNRAVYVALYNKNNKSWLIYGTGYTYKVVAYIPIPSFDEILEANRDVLERIKEKGD